MNANRYDNMMHLPSLPMADMDQNMDCILTYYYNTFAPFAVLPLNYLSINVATLSMAICCGNSNKHSIMYCLAPYTDLHLFFLRLNSANQIYSVKNI